MHFQFRLIRTKGHCFIYFKYCLIQKDYCIGSLSYVSISVRNWRKWHKIRKTKFALNRILNWSFRGTSKTSNFTICDTGLNIHTARVDDSLSVRCKAPYTLSVKLSDFTVLRHTWRKNWVNCTVLTGNSAGLRTGLSSPLSHRKLRSSLRESHSFLSLPADTTMALSKF